MKAVGTNTAISTSEIASTAVPTSSMVRCAAARGASPIAMLRSTFSTTTMASSTTMPTASTRPNKVSMLSEKPKPVEDRQRADERYRYRDDRHDRHAPVIAGRR